MYCKQATTALAETTATYSGLQGSDRFFRYIRRLLAIWGEANAIEKSGTEKTAIKI